jgi:hypothetical protein
MEKAKNDVLSLCTADVQLTHVQFAEQLLLSEQIEKATTEGTNTTHRTYCLHFDHGSG